MLYDLRLLQHFYCVKLLTKNNNNTFLRNVDMVISEQLIDVSIDDQGVKVTHEKQMRQGHPGSPSHFECCWIFSFTFDRAVLDLKRIEFCVTNLSCDPKMPTEDQLALREQLRLGHPQVHTRTSLPENLARILWGTKF